MAAEKAAISERAHAPTLLVDDPAPAQDGMSSGHCTPPISTRLTGVSSVQIGRNESIPSLVQLQHLTCEPANDDSEADQHARSQLPTNVESPLSLPSTNIPSSESTANLNGGHVQKEIGSERQDSRYAQERKRQLPTSGIAVPEAKRRPSRETTADSAGKSTSPLGQVGQNSNSVSIGRTRTEQQLLTSRSNYEIIRSGGKSVHGIAFPAPLLASMESKRARHQREEKVRRDRMKVAMETLADLLPHTPKNADKVHLVEKAAKHIRDLHMQLDATIHARMGIARFNHASESPS